MIRLTPYLSALVALLTVFFYAAPQGNVEDVSSANASMQTIELPLEVMHYDVFGEHEGNSELPMYGGNSPRYVESVTFDVSGTPGDLWLWGHHIGFQYFGDWFNWQQGAGDLVDVTSDYDAPYDGRAKAAIRINGGDWIDLINDNVTCQENEEAQACIQGFMSSNRFRVHNTAAMLQSGSNTIEFAFLGHEMLSSGYRILDFVVLPSGYTGSLSHRDVRPVDLITNNKTLDYLDTEAPAGADPVQGETLWHERNSLVDWPGGPEIIASCNDCHAMDGMDMEYFGYSNNSITVRSRHHGLTQQEGENIAAFIRSQTLLDENGVAYDPPGRPWNPPYQPAPRGFGPNNEHPYDAPQQYWSAGAGLDWIADSEADVWPYLFPDGTANHDAGPFEQPGGISITATQFRWDTPPPNSRAIPQSVQMPDWNMWLPIIHPIDAFGETAWQEKAANAKQSYSNALSGGSERDMSNAVARLLNIGHSSETLDQNTQWNRWVLGDQDSDGRMGIGQNQHASVTGWELSRRLHKEGHTGNDVDKYGERGWIIAAGAQFRVGSHIATADYQIAIGPPAPQKGVVHSHIWYHLQLLLNGHHHDGTGGRPMDWNYHADFLRGFDTETGLDGATRNMVSRAQLHHLLGNNGGPVNVRPYGTSHARHRLFQFWRLVDNVSTFSTLDQETLNKIANQYVSGWLAGMYQYPREDWERGTHTNDWGLPEDRPEIGSYSVWTDAANEMYNALFRFEEDLNLSPTALDSLARLGNELFSEPKDGNPGWDTFFLENVAAFGLSMAGGSSQVAPASVTLTTDPDGAPDEVRFYQNDVLIDTRTGPPWETAVSGLPEGTYTFRAESQIGQDVFDSSLRTLNVNAAWVRENLNPRSRGGVTGALNLLPEHIQLEATGTDSGLRPKDAPQQYEAVDECRLDERWDFSFDGFSGQYGVWGRAGIQIESDHVDGHEVVLLDYLPLQRRMRLSVAKSDESSVRQLTSKINLDTPLTGYVKIEDIQQRAHFQFYLDTTGDGEYDVIRSAHMDTLFDACEISLIATSRSSSQQIEALFTLEKVE